MDKLKDVYMHFLLYYGRDIPKMHNALKRTNKKSKKRTVQTKIIRRPVKKMVTRTIRRPKEKKPKEDGEEDEEEKEEKEDKEEGEEDGEEKEKKVRG